MQTAPNQPWARRCYGWALLKAGEPGKAIEVLDTISQTDAWAALGLAKAFHASGNDKAAGQALDRVERISPTGPAHRAAMRWARHVNIAMPAPAAGDCQTGTNASGGVRQDAAGSAGGSCKVSKTHTFDGRTAAAGHAMVRPSRDSTNRSKLPIYCGPYAAVVANVLVSAIIFDPGSRDIGQRLVLSLAKRFVLKPGETFSLYRPLGSGPLYSLLVDPLKRVQVMFRLILNPMRTERGEWVPGPVGLGTAPLALTRSAHQPPKSQELLGLARGGSQQQKIDVARWIACIVSGRRQGPQSQPALGAQSLLTQAMVALLSSPDPLVVAHALSRPEQTPLIKPIFEAAMPHVNDANWLTRLMAVRFFAHEQGNKFTRALKNISRSDPDPIVRQLMAAYYAQYAAGGK